MPELQVPQTGEDIASGTFGQPVVFRVLSRYTNAAQRDALAPSPGDGEPAYLQDVDALQVYDGTQWVTYQPATPVQYQTVLVDEGIQGSVGLFEYTWRDDAFVTCSFQILGRFNFDEDIALVDAIPSQFRPNTERLYVPVTAYSDVGLVKNGETVAAQFRTNGVVFLRPPSTAQLADTYKGVMTWALGTTGALPPDRPPV